MCLHRLLHVLHSETVCGLRSLCTCSTCKAMLSSVRMTATETPPFCCDVLCVPCRAHQNLKQCREACACTQNTSVHRQSVSQPACLPCCQSRQLALETNPRLVEPEKLCIADIVSKSTEVKHCLRLGQVVTPGQSRKLAPLRLGTRQILR